MARPDYDALECDAAPPDSSVLPGVPVRFGISDAIIDDVHVFFKTAVGLGAARDAVACGPTPIFMVWTHRRTSRPRWCFGPARLCTHQCWAACTPERCGPRNQWRSLKMGKSRSLGRWPAPGAYIFASIRRSPSGLRRTNVATLAEHGDKTSGPMKPAFALGDYEWILAGIEVPELDRIVDHGAVHHRKPPYPRGRSLGRHRSAPEQPVHPRHDGSADPTLPEGDTAMIWSPMLPPPPRESSGPREAVFNSWLRWARSEVAFLDLYTRSTTPPRICGHRRSAPSSGLGQRVGRGVGESPGRRRHLTLDGRFDTAAD